MPLRLVLHDLGAAPAEAAEEFFQTFFGVAPDHWRLMPGATLVGTGLSPGYLLEHLTATAKRCGISPIMLLVIPVPDEIAAEGLPHDGEAWILDMLG
jgi:hypothetical protein